MEKLTLEQAIIVSGYTGYLCCPFSKVHKAIEKKLGRPVWTHEMASGTETTKQIKEAFKPDFLAICAEGTNVES